MTKALLGIALCLSVGLVLWGLEALVGAERLGWLVAGLIAVSWAISDYRRRQKEHADAMMRWLGLEQKEKPQDQRRVP